MLDRLFMPALTFTLLVAATAAFAVEFSSDPRQSSLPAQAVVTLERVVVTIPATDLALARAERGNEANATR